MNVKTLLKKQRFRTNLKFSTYDSLPLEIRKNCRKEFSRHQICYPNYVQQQAQAGQTTATQPAIQYVHRWVGLENVFTRELKHTAQVR